MAELSNTITDLKRDKIFYQEKLAATVEDINNKQKAHSRQVRVLNERSDILRKRLAAKFEKLSQIVVASKDTNNSVADILKSATKEIEEMWFQRDNCVIIPCRHHANNMFSVYFLLRDVFILLRAYKGNDTHLWFIL